MVIMVVVVLMISCVTFCDWVILVTVGVSKPFLATISCSLSLLVMMAMTTT